MYSSLTKEQIEALEASKLNQGKIAGKLVFSTENIPIEAKIQVKKLNIYHNPEKLNRRLLETVKYISKVDHHFVYKPSEKWLKMAKKRQEYMGNIENRRKIANNHFRRYILTHRMFIDKVLPLLYSIQKTY